MWLLQKNEKECLLRRICSKTLNEKYIAIAIDGERGEGVNLVKKHKVRGYPTQFVFDSKGDVLKRNDGYMGESKLLSFLK